MSSFRRSSRSPPSSPPPSKRFRSEEMDLDLFKYIEDVAVPENRTLQGHEIHKSRSTFKITKFPENPESVLGGIFYTAAKRAIVSSKENNLNVDTIGFILNSENLKEGSPLYMPFQPINDVTIESFLKLFLKVEQSRTAEGKSLFDVPLEIEVTVYNKQQEYEDNMFGGVPSRNIGTVIHNIAENEKIIVENQIGNRCLFYALHVALQHQIAGLKETSWRNYRKSLHGFTKEINGRRNARNVHNQVENLMRTLNIPLGEKSYDACKWVPIFVNYWNDILHTGRHKIKVWIFEPRGNYKPSYKFGPKDNDYNIELVIYYQENHFIALYQSGALFGQPYCLECETNYDKGSTHKASCKKKCLNCSRVGAVYPCKKEEGLEIKCTECNKTFKSNSCYQYHISSNFCKHSKSCGKCGVIWDKRLYEKNGWGSHVCGSTECNTCHGYHKKGDKRGCFIKPYEVKPEEPVRFIAFDIETTEIEEIIPPKRPNDTPRTQKNLVPNFISAKVACQNCIRSGEWKSSKMSKPCSVCGPYRTITFGTHPFGQTYVDKAVTCNDPDKPPILEFTKWLLDDLPQKFNSYIYSHFGGRFDMQFVIVELYKLGFDPSLVRKGNKLITLDIKKKNKHKLKFRDSYNLFNMRLEQLPSAFGLDVIDKGNFPHKLNRPENFDKILYPTVDDFMAKDWTSEKCIHFMENFEEKPFYLNEELPAYCTNDTEILMAALIAFRHEFMEISKRNIVDENGDADRAGHFKKPHNGLDPLIIAPTIARACINLFKANHLPSHHLAMVPERGYDRKDNQSDIAYRYLRWLEEEEKVQIQTAYTEGGEKRFGKYPVDGYYEKKNEEDQIEKVIIEVNGCNIHGCQKCWPDENKKIPKIGKTPLHLRQKHAWKVAYLKKFVDRVDVIWTCKIDEELRKNPEMRKRFKQYKDRSPLDPREAFYGGRTGPLSLFYEPKEGEKISYYDFTSLYPYVNYMLDEWMMGYPVGHPKVHIINEEVNWTSAADNPYKVALLKCFVIPPRQIDIPILPMKVKEDGDERLLFPLCSKCARDHEDGGFYENYQCTHTDEERGWTSTCTSVELDAALNEGYRVTHLVRVYEYEYCDRELFRGFMSEFLALKIHASGFDKKIEGNAEEKEKFIRACEEKFGIIIDRDLMKTDKGKRALAKLIVNNLWGRFAMRNWGLYKTEITHKPSRVGKLLADKTIEIMHIDELIEGTKEKPSVVMITYIPKKDFVDENDASNVVISLWTTACARLLLLRSMQKVVRTPGCKLHYVDTDSLIFSHPINNCPLVLGPHIGDFTDELPEHDILEVCFGGAKQYGIKMRKKNDPNAKIEYMLKIRGITLSYNVMENQGLTYNKLKELVLKYVRTGTIDSIKICLPVLEKSLKKGGKSAPIYSFEREKIYKPVVSKGIIKKGDYTVYNFGQTIPS